MRNGHSVATSGPLVIFTINNEIIGNTAQVASGTRPTLNISWKSTNEFGSISRIDIYKNGNKIDTLSPSSLGRNSLDDSYSWTDSQGITSTSYYRLEAFTNIGHRAYTNPIWVEIGEATVGGFTFSEASDSGDSPSDRPYNVQLRISTDTTFSISGLSIQNLSTAGIDWNAPIINGSVGPGREVDKSIPRNKTGYVGPGTPTNKTTRNMTIQIANETELVGYTYPGVPIAEKVPNLTGYVAPGVEVNKTRRNASTGNITAQTLCTNSFIWDTYIQNRVDRDYDGYYEGFDIEIDADFPEYETCGVRAKIVASTGQSWWVGPWDIYDGSSSDNYRVHFDMAQFGLSSEREVTFTVYLYSWYYVDTGSSDTVSVYVDSAVPMPYVYDTYVRNGVDSDGDGYYEGFDIEIDADVPGYSTAYVKAKIVASTGQSWDTSVWSIYDGATDDNHRFHLDMSQFNLASPQTVTFTVQLYRSDGTPTGSSDTVTARIDNPRPPCEGSYIFNTYISNAVDADGDGYYESFKIEIDADTTGSFSCNLKAKIVASTGQSWWTPAWSFYGTSDGDNYFFPREMGDFGFTSPQQVGFTVYLYTADGVDTGSSDTVTANVDSLVPYIYDAYISDGIDRDGDGYYESFNITMDADIGGSLTTYVKAYIVASTGQTRWTSAWQISGTGTEYYHAPFHMDQFNFASPQQVTFTVHLYLSDGRDTGSTKTVAAKVDSPSVRGVRSAMVYWRYGSPTIDASTNDGSLVMTGSVDAPSGTWSASIPAPGDSREGQVLYWRVYATDNAAQAASAWSPAYTGGMILDEDTAPPAIGSIQVSEYNGNGDGVISDREQVRISWSASDPSGIGSTPIAIDGEAVGVQGSYYAIAGPFAAGEHSYRIAAYDGDNSRAYGERTGNFNVVFVDTSPPVVQYVWHSPLAPSGSDPITVYATISDDGEVSVVLHHSTDGATWTTSPMALYVSPQSASSSTPAKKKLLVKQKKGKKVPKEDIERARGREIKEIPKLGYKVVETDDAESFKREIKKHRDVEHVQEAVPHSILAPSDGYYQEQLNLKSINAEEAWSHTMGEGVLVAVLDTGVNYAHPDLNDNYIGGYDFVNDDGDPSDDNGHGTHVAGIIAAEMDGEGTVGVAPKAKILAEKVLDSSGVGYDYDVASAIVHAADNGATVISMSFGGAYSLVIEDAAEYAYGKGVLLVAAAGNNRGSVLYPAALGSVIAVSSVDPGNQISAFSSHGSEIELAAPGEGILSTYGNSYSRSSGTSMAAAHVSGMAALARQLHTNWSSGELQSFLHSATLDLGGSGRDEYYGYGLIDASKIDANAGLPSNTTTPPEEGITSPPAIQALRTYYATIGPFPEGRTLYRVSAQDSSGNSVVDDNGGNNHAIVVDTTPPTGSITINSGATHTGTTSATLSLSCSDAGICAQTQFSNDGVAYSTPEVYVTVRSWALVNGDGTKTVYVKFRDGAGNWGAPVSDTIILDTAPPVVTINSPAGTVYRDSAELGYSISEPAAWTGYSLDGAANVTITGGATLTGLQDGQHSLTVYARDAAGNLGSAVVYFTVRLDAEPPSITLLSPANTNIRAGQKIDLEIVDNVGVDQVWYSRNSGANTTLTSPYGIATDGWLDGPLVIDAWASDAVGNKAWARYRFTVDTTPPVTMDDAPPGWQRADLAVSLRASDALSGVAYTSYSVDGGVWVNGTSIPIAAEGKHSIEYYSVDNAGNSEAVERTHVALDKTAPSTVITGVEEGFYNRDVIANVTVLDPNLDGASIILDGVPYISGTLISVEGAHTLEASATDLAGNAAHTNTSFVLDKTIPAVRVISPTEGPYLRGIVEIAGSAGDAYLDTTAISINGSVVSGTASHTWDTTQVPDGSYEIELRAVDRAANSASESVTVTVDNTLPVVALTELANSSVRGIVGLEGGATDANLASLSLKIDGREVPSPPPYAWGTASYSDGMHDIELTAIDRAGNSASASIGIITDNTPPSIEVQHPQEIADYMQFEINATVLDADNVTFLLNSTPMAYNISTSGQSQCLGPFARGAAPNFEVLAKDEAGNIAREGFSIAVEEGEVKIEGGGRLKDKEEKETVRLELEAGWKRGEAKGELQLNVEDRGDREKFKAHGKIETLYKDCRGVFRVSGVARVEVEEGKEKSRERNVSFAGNITDGVLDLMIDDREFLLPAKVRIEERVVAEQPRGHGPPEP